MPMIQRKDKTLGTFFQEHRVGIFVGSIGWIFAFPYLVYTFLTHDMRIFEHLFMPDVLFILAWIPGFMLAGYLYDRKIVLLKKLGESEKRYRDFIEHAGDAIIAADRDGKILMVNKQAEELTGYSKEEFLSLHIHELFAMKKDAQRTAFEECYGSGQSKVRDARLLRKDGTEVYVDINYSLISLNGKDVLIGIIRDISERKHAEEELLDLKNFNEEIVEKSPVGILRLDKDMRLIYENPSAKRIMGVPRGEESRALGMDVRRIPSVLESGISGEFDKLLERKEIVLELPFRSIYGKNAIIRLRGVPLLRNGKFEGAILIIEDISQRRKMEEALEAERRQILSVFEGIDEAVYVVDPDTYEILFINKPIRDSFGDIVGRKCYDALQNQPAPCSFCTNSKIFGENLGKTYIWENQNQVNKRWYKCIDKAIKWPNGKWVRYEMAIDITEMKRSQENLWKAYEKLKSVDEMKSNLIARVSHELRTPITITKGAIEIAMDEEDPEKRKLMLTMAIDAMNRENRIVGDLISFAEMETGEAKIRLESVSLRSVIGLVIHEMRRGAEKKGITISSTADDLNVKADFNAVMHVLRNLLENAIKFNIKGGEIFIETEKKDGFVETCVSDTGIGIPHDELDKIFEPFYQVDSSLTRRYGGTGMGLAIVKEIVEAHGGKVIVTSEVGRGSKFCFSLPVSGP